MKKILICSVISLFVFVMFYAGVCGANSDDSNRQGVQSQNQIQAQVQTQTDDNAGVQTQAQNQEGGNTVMIQAEQQVRVRTSGELKEAIQERKQEMKQELDEMKEEQKEIFQNQNKVRETVHTLLASEDLVGGIGEQVSAVAREFNNSVQATILAEEKINSRSKFVKFFMGGDEDAADEIKQEVNINRDRIKNLNQLMKGCECGDEIRNIIQEQIRNVEQEQNRLDELVIGEKAKKGLFGWFKNIFRFGR